MQRLFIITPLSRPEHLSQIATSIEVAMAQEPHVEVVWLVVVDRSCVARPEFSRPYARLLECGVPSVGGNAQRNHALDWIKNLPDPTGHVYFCDDDTIVAPELLSNLRPLLEQYPEHVIMVGQHVWLRKAGQPDPLVRPTGPHLVQLNAVDTGQGIFATSIVAHHRWVVNGVGDGPFYEEVFRDHRDAFHFVDTPITYYNYIEAPPSPRQVSTQPCSTVGLTLSPNGPGIGDSVWLSAVAQRWFEERGTKVVIETPYPELFDYHPAVERCEAYTGRKMFPVLDNPAALAEHSIDIMCRDVGLTPPPVRRQWLHLRPYESAEGGYVTMHVRPGPWTRNKDWLWSRWLELAARCHATGLHVVQVGGGDDPRLPDTESALGLPLRRTMATIAAARLHVGGVSGPMHIASGVGTPSIIVVGGRENPAITCYPHDHLLLPQAKLECMPCWKVEPCPYATTAPSVSDFHRPCVDDITTDRVFAAIQETLGGIRTAD